MLTAPTYNVGHCPVRVFPTCRQRRRPELPVSCIPIRCSSAAPSARLAASSARSSPRSANPRQTTTPRTPRPTGDCGAVAGWMAVPSYLLAGGPARTTRAARRVRARSCLAVMQPAGGRIVLGTQDDIAPNALPQPVTIQITKSTTPPPQPYVDYSPVYEIQPAGLTFATPALLFIGMANVPGVVPRELAVYTSTDGGSELHGHPRLLQECRLPDGVALAARAGVRRLPAGAIRRHRLRHERRQPLSRFGAAKRRRESDAVRGVTAGGSRRK